MTSIRHLDLRKKAAGFVRRVVASDTLRMRIGHRTIDLAFDSLDSF